MKKLFIFLCLIGFSEIAAQTQKTIYKNGQPIGIIIIIDIVDRTAVNNRTAVSNTMNRNDYIIGDEYAADQIKPAPVTNNYIISEDERLSRVMIIPQQPGQIRVTFRNFRTNQISVLYSGYAPARTSLLLPLNL